MEKARYIMKKVQQSLDKSPSLNNKSCFHYKTNLEHAVRSVRMYRPTAPNIRPLNLVCVFTWLFLIKIITDKRKL